MADGVSASSSSEDERERSGSPPRQKNTKKVNRLFVWLPKRLKATPRGSHWDKLNRDGSVKEIEVDAGHSERRLRANGRKLPCIGYSGPVKVGNVSFPIELKRQRGRGK